MFALDHVVLLVQDLAQAAFDLGGLGFTVVYGGEHASGETHNALVAFEDGSYLELLAWRSLPGELEGAAARWSRWRLSGQGLVDFALRPRDLDQDLAGARDRGLEILGPVPGGRERPDGVRVEWRLGLPALRWLPFLCGDTTPRERRIPSGPACRHLNGATGIAAIHLGAQDLEHTARELARLLGVPTPREAAPRFDLGTTVLHLEFALGAPVIRRLELSRRPGSPAVEGFLSPNLTHGAAIAWASR